MRRQVMIEMAGATGLRPLVLFGLLMVPGPFAEAQKTPSNIGDAPVVPRSSAIQGRDASLIDNGKAGGDQDSRLLIAHGLEMAIEGSTLQGFARQPGVSAAGASALASGSPTIGSRPGTAGTPGTNPTGLGFTGSPGETVSGRPVTTPATGTGSETLGATGTGPSSLGKIGTTAGLAGTGAAVASATNGATPAVPMTGGSPASILQQRAGRSFQASNDLLGQSDPAQGPDRGFSEAAKIYAATLKSLGAQTSSTIGAAELTSIALINHAVKEALGSFRIKQLVGTTASSSSPATRQLLAHARQMDDESRSTIQSISAGTAGPGGAVQNLAQQANRLIMAMQALNPEPAAPGR